LHTGRHGHDSPTGLAREALLRAMRHGFLTNIMTNTHRGNIDGLSDLVNWAKANEVSVRSVPFSPIGKRAKANGHIANRVEDVERAAEFWLEECNWEHIYHSHAGLCVGSIFNYGLSLAYMTRRCASGRYLCYVAADGTLFPCTMCAGENIFAADSIAGGDFASVWRSFWPMRQHSWDDFATACQGCPINTKEYYCAARCPAMSHARHGTYHQCGASEFEIASTIYRTKLLNNSSLGAASNIPVKSG
jgi:radical SAM protein with 4Fe4S-binding SPASM domain